MARAQLSSAEERILDRADAYEQKHLEATLEASRMAIKGLLTVNSAGMVAMIGLAKDMDPWLQKEAGFSVLLLAIGSGLSLLLFLVNYFGQLAEYLASKHRKTIITAEAIYLASIAIWLIGAALFVWAALNIAIPLAS